MDDMFVYQNEDGIISLGEVSLQLSFFGSLDTTPLLPTYFDHFPVEYRPAMVVVNVLALSFVGDDEGHDVTPNFLIGHTMHLSIEHTIP